MIKPEDFSIKISNQESGITIRIRHLPTGNQRVSTEVSKSEVKSTTNRLIKELRGLLFQEKDVRFDTGRSQAGAFIRVIHIPSGMEKSSMLGESTHEQLLDEILTELHSRRTKD